MVVNVVESTLFVFNIEQHMLARLMRKLRILEFRLRRDDSQRLNWGCPAANSFRLDPIFSGDFVRRHGPLAWFRKVAACFG